MKKFLALSSVLLLAACGGEVAQSDLKDAINDTSFNRVCLPFQLNAEPASPQTMLGAPEIKLLKRTPEGKRTNQHAIKQMETLVRAGLYKADKEERVGTADKVSRFAVYSMTDRGREEIKISPHGSLLCIGKQKVQKINYFTEPTPNRGVLVTHVSYEAKIQPEKWASGLIKETEYKDMLKETATRQAVLMKTNKGWRDVRELHHK